MATLKYKNSNGDYQTLVGYTVENDVVQTTGSSTTSVMSQNAVTTALSGKANSSDVYTKTQIDAMRSPSYSSSLKKITFPANATFEYVAADKKIILSQ